MKEQVKALWKRCFDDSDAFIEMYFELRYTDERNIALKNEGQVISALQLIPYPITFCGCTVPTSYISGACTHPNLRGKGAMRDLLTQAFENMQKTGFLFSTLIPAEPWLFSYYERMGYASAFQYSTKDVAVSDCIGATDITIATITEYKANVYQYFNEKLVQRPCCIQHTPEDFKVIMADIALSNGYLLVASQDNRIVGLAILYKEENHAFIKELLTDHKEVEDTLFYHIHQQVVCDRATVMFPPHSDSEPATVGMARIIDAKAVLQRYANAFPEKEMLLSLVDSQLPSNDGFYCLSKGTCTFSTNGVSETHTKMNISELTSILLHPLHPYMSLMLN